MARILAVDDERAILDALARVLGRDGHEVVKAADPTAVPGMDLSRFDLVLCDVMMPGLDGFELVRQIRPDFDGPIIFLTARVAEEDAVAGYGLGADDYVRKPFGAAELRAKVAAHLRRERRPRSHALSFGEVRIDLGARGLAVGGEAVPLTPTEYAICEYLARHPGQVMSRAQIREGEVFLDAHVRRGAAQRVLKQPPDDAAAVMLACKGNVLAIQQNTALVHIKATCDGVEKRGLARAVRADNGDEITLVQMERQIGNGALFVHRSDVEGLGDVLNVQHISCPPSLLPRPCGAGTPPTFGCSARRWPAPR